MKYIAGLNTLNAVVISVGLLAASASFAGQLVAKEYPISKVSEVTVSGAGTIEIVQGTAESLIVEADSEVMPDVHVDLTGHRLSLRLRGDENWFNWFGRKNNRDQVRYMLTVTHIEEVELSGAMRGHASNLTAQDLTVKLSGAANMDLETVDSKGLVFDLSGAANAKVQRLNASQLDIKLSGAANLEVKASGPVTKAKVDASGASNLKAKALTVKQADVGASGASNISLTVTDRLDAGASGASNISYGGTPQVKQDSSGASHIKPL